MKSVLYLLLILFAGITYGYSQTSIYVSPDGDDSNAGTKGKPFRTIQKALDESAVSKVGTILLRGGSYQMDKPIVIRPEHSGTAAGLTISAEDNAKAVISGGKELTGWEKQINGRWVTEIPEVKSGNWKFRQLFVNGEPRQRARKPNTGFLRVKGMPDGTPGTTGWNSPSHRFEFSAGDINPRWKNLKDVEVVVYHFWIDSHFPVQSVDEKTNVVTFTKQTYAALSDNFSENGARYIVENVFEELDAPGEWYLDRKTGKCYYYPFPGEEPGKAQIFAPLAEQLIRFEGDPITQKMVKNISFHNLEFCYTNWELPSDDPNLGQGSSGVAAAITLKGAQNCSFTHCKFANLGTWAVELTEGCSGNTFSNNEIDHVAAGGFHISGGKYDKHPLLRTSNNRITDNHIHNYGEVYPSAVGVLAEHTEGNLISHNHIHHGYYTGISVGCEWGYQRSISRDNIIEYNHIHDIGQGLMSDMGGIYTLGVSPGTVIRNNLIHDVDAHDYGGWGIYMDEGSTHILIENNVVYNTRFASLNIHYSKEATVRNNIFALGRLEQLSRERSDPHKSVYFEQNIIYWKEGVLLNKNWEDKPYQFYFRANVPPNWREVNETFDMDYNLWFNPGKKLEEVDFNGKTWEKWNAMGKDIHSLYADPLFIDAEHFDFRLKENSPAFQLGFKNIDTSTVGPRGKTGTESLFNDHFNQTKKRL
jgi:parallel beta-helix repeat protein